jgi:transposase
VVITDCSLVHLSVINFSVINITLIGRPELVPCHKLWQAASKDAATLAKILDPATFQGIVMGDNAAVCAKFTRARKCRAHLLRKAITLTLLEPTNQEYRAFTDRRLEIYRAACRVRRDGRLSDAGRRREIAALEEELLEPCGPMWFAELPLSEGTANDDRLLVNALMRRMVAEQLFPCVTAPPVEMPNGQRMVVPGTNNGSAQTLRSPAEVRDTPRGSKTPRGGRRRSVVASVLESLRRFRSTFTLSSVVEEITRWSINGQSCFAELAAKLNPCPPTESRLDLYHDGGGWASPYNTGTLLTWRRT